MGSSLFNSAQEAVNVLAEVGAANYETKPVTIMRSRWELLELNKSLTCYYPPTRLWAGVEAGGGSGIMPGRNQAFCKANMRQ